MKPINRLIYQVYTVEINRVKTFSSSQDLLSHCIFFFFLPNIDLHFIKRKRFCSKTLIDDLEVLQQPLHKDVMIQF